MTDLNPQQFLFHGTASEVHGDRLLPAKVHGGRSYWGDTNSHVGEGAQDHAWAHPDEHVTWDAALDRTNVHYAEGEAVGPRARVYAVKPNKDQTPGTDKSMAGEIKAPHFDISHRLDIKPGHQGTFPEVNWNAHAKGGGSGLPGDGDANHPTDPEIAFGHKAGVYSSGNYGEPEKTTAHLQQAARDEDTNRYLDRLDDRNIRPKYVDNRDQHLPGMVNKDQFTGRRR